jgi:hypothetical protein
VTYDAETAARSATRSAHRANLIAAASLIATVLSVFFTFKQAIEAQTANEFSASLQAQNVYIDVPDVSSGELRYYVNNRNSLPVSDVYVQYTLDGASDPLLTTVGLLPGCSGILIMAERQNLTTTKRPASSQQHYSSPTLAGESGNETPLVLSSSPRRPLVGRESGSHTES